MVVVVLESDIRWQTPSDSEQNHESPLSAWYPYKSVIGTFSSIWMLAFSSTVIIWDQ